MSETGEISLTKTPIPDIEPREFELKDVDIEKVSLRVGKKREELPKSKKDSLADKLVVGIAATTLFLGGLGLVKVADKYSELQETRSYEITEIPPQITDENANENQISPKPDIDPHIYPVESSRIIEKISSNLGVEIISPTVWDENGVARENLSWTKEELEILDDALSSLPISYYANNERAPERIYLIKPVDTKGGSVGGAYGNRELFLYLPEDFEADISITTDQRDIGSVTYKEWLKGTLFHEWTHSFTESHPEILADWVNKTGWEETSDGDWFNKNPENLPAYVEHFSMHPIEDIAVSAELLHLNPSTLSEDRINFFLENPFYSGWEPVDTYKARQNS